MYALFDADHLFGYWDSIRDCVRVCVCVRACACIYAIFQETRVKLWLSAACLDPNQPLKLVTFRLTKHVLISSLNMTLSTSVQPVTDNEALLTVLLVIL